MTGNRKSVVTVTGFVLLVALAAAFTPGSSFAAKPPVEVVVLNTPIEVTGALDVSGTAEVTSADLTQLLDSFAGSVDGGDAFTEAISGEDVSWAKTVRVMTNCFSGADCGDINVRVYTVVGNRSYLIDQFPMQSFLAVTRVYEVIGANLSVQLQNSNAAAIPNVGVAAFARAN
jgi:hypothetical protein